MGNTTKLLSLSIMALLFQVGCAATEFTGSDSSDSSVQSSTSSTGIRNSEAEDPTLEEPDPEAEAECDKFRSSVSSLAVVTNFTAKHVRGSLAVAATNLTLEDIRGKVEAYSNKADLLNMRGPLCLVGLAQNASGNIVDHRGPIYLSGMTATIENSRGHLVIRDSKITLIKNHRGAIHLINSTIENLENVGGHISVDANSSVP